MYYIILLSIVSCDYYKDELYISSVSICRDIENGGNRISINYIVHNIEVDSNEVNTYGIFNSNYVLEYNYDRLSGRIFLISTPVMSVNDEFHTDRLALLTLEDQLDFIEAESLNDLDSLLLEFVKKSKIIISINSSNKVLGVSSDTRYFFKSCTIDTIFSSQKPSLQSYLR